MKHSNAGFSNEEERRVNITEIGLPDLHPISETLNPKQLSLIRMSLHVMCVYVCVIALSVKKFYI